MPHRLTCLLPQTRGGTGSSPIVCIVKRNRWRVLAVEGIAVAILLAACTTIVVRTLGSSSPAPTTPLSASLAADGRSAATLQVLTGTPVLKIGVANLGGGTLVRVTTPAGGPAPELRVDGTDSGVIDLSAENASGNASAVTVTLSSAVTWQLDLGGGTKQTVVDLRGGQVTGVAFTAGSDVINLTLPRPQGSVLVKLAAGASQLLLSRPTGVPVRLTAAAGAGEVTLDGKKHVGVPDGSVFTTPGWTSNATGFDVDATAGAASVAVTTWSS